MEIKVGAKKSSTGISLLKIKEMPLSEVGEILEISEAAELLRVNEFYFRKFLVIHFFNSKGLPKEKFVQKGLFCILSKELWLSNVSIASEKVGITQKGIEFLGWFLFIKNFTKND